MLVFGFRVTLDITFQISVDTHLIDMDDFLVLVEDKYKS